jgi:EpsI family protein
MRTVSPGRLALLSLLLMLTIVVGHYRSVSGSLNTAKRPLKEAFAVIGGWRQVGNVNLDARIVEELKLDDYLFRSYRRDTGLVNLYVGYYRSAGKIGAAHDPLVCFQGQGWQINSRDSGELPLSRRPDLNVSYSSMIAQREDDREYIVYWFQSNGKSNANTQSQKWAMFLDKFSGSGEDNAFVRVSAPIGGDTPESVRKRLFAFIEEFYPEFRRYLTKG